MMSELLRMRCLNCDVAKENMRSLKDNEELKSAVQKLRHIPSDGYICEDCITQLSLERNDAALNCQFCHQKCKGLENYRRHLFHCDIFKILKTKTPKEYNGKSMVLIMKRLSDQDIQNLKNGLKKVKGSRVERKTIASKKRKLNFTLKFTCATTCNNNIVNDDIISFKELPKVEQPVRLRIEKNSSVGCSSSKYSNIVSYIKQLYLSKTVSSTTRQESLISLHSDGVEANLSHNGLKINAVYSIGNEGTPMSQNISRQFRREKVNKSFGLIAPSLAPALHNASNENLLQNELMFQSPSSNVSNFSVDVLTEGVMQNPYVCASNAGVPTILADATDCMSSLIPINQPLMSVPQSVNLRIRSVNELNYLAANGNSNNSDEHTPPLNDTLSDVNAPDDSSHKLKVTRITDQLQVFLEHNEDIIDIQELDGEAKLKVREYLEKEAFIYGLQETCKKEQQKQDDSFVLLKQQIQSIFDGNPPPGYSFLFSS